MNAPRNADAKPGIIMRIGRWLFSWPTVRRALIVLAGLVTLVAVLVTEEDWRGKRAWEKYKRAEEAKGEHFDLASIVPPPVPDDQNFFGASIVARIFASDQNKPVGASELFDVKPSDRINFSIYRGNSDNWPAHGGSWQKATLTDLTQWQSYFRSMAESDPTNAFPVAPQPQTPAADVLLALSKFDPAVDQLRRASERPYARLPLNYENGFQEVSRELQVLAGIKRTAQMLQLRTIAELQSGRSQEALEDDKLVLRLTDSIRNQPFLIAHLVRIATMAITIQPVYEGLAEHRWSDSQLADLERELAKIDLLADYEYAMRGERICGIEAIENQRITRQWQAFVQDPSGNRIVTNSLRFVPSAFFYRNQLAIARLHDQFVRPLVDATNRIISPEVERRAEAAVNEQRKHASLLKPYNIEALMIFPAVSKSVVRFAVVQCSVDMARFACALERYRLAHGEYPESLDAVTSQFIEKLPHDVINGKPLHYRRMENGFTLYSIGWNETDDGGHGSVKKSGSVDSEKGDWVWKYPAK